MGTQCEIRSDERTDQTTLERRVEELERRFTELEEWLAEVADDLIERTGAA